MTKGKGFSVISTIAAALALAALIFSFTVPSAYTKDTERMIGHSIERTKEALFAGNMDAVRESVEEIYVEFQRRKDKLMLISHDDNVEQMERAINCCRDLARLEQSDNLICELNSLYQITRHMMSMESTDMTELF